MKIGRDVDLVRGDVTILQAREESHPYQTPNSNKHNRLTGKLSGGSDGNACNLDPEESQQTKRANELRRI